MNYYYLRNVTDKIQISCLEMTSLWLINLKKIYLKGFGGHSSYFNSLFQWLYFLTLLNHPVYLFPFKSKFVPDVCVSVSVIHIMF